MATTWNKTECTNCGQTERVHGKPPAAIGAIAPYKCINCWKTHVERVVLVSWGDEKYTGEKARTTERLHKDGSIKVTRR